MRLNLINYLPLLQVLEKNFLYCLAGLCGLRVSEIMGLTWNDINFNSHVIYIRRTNVHVNCAVIEKSTKTRTSYRKVVAPSYVIERWIC
nr:tyrosine-type recombinase/integrase [Clostridium sp. JN-1]